VQYEYTAFTYVSEERGFTVERAGAVWVAHKRETRVIGKASDPTVTKTGVVARSNSEVVGGHVLRRAIRVRKSVRCESSTRTWLYEWKDGTSASDSRIEPFQKAH
jgi:hypothetical protein